MCSKFFTTCVEQYREYLQHRPGYFVATRPGRYRDRGAVHCIRCGYHELRHNGLAFVRDAETIILRSLGIHVSPSPAQLSPANADPVRLPADRGRGRDRDLLGCGNRSSAVGPARKDCGLSQVWLLNSTARSRSSRASAREPSFSYARARPSNASASVGSRLMTSPNSCIARFVSPIVL